MTRELEHAIAKTIEDHIAFDVDFGGIVHLNDTATEDAARAIITLFREALLSNEVQAPIRQELHHYPRTSTRDTVNTVIDMALDAVAGEGGER